MPEVYKKSEITRAMETKNKSIQKFQKTKEEAIQLAGVNRDAILLVTSSPETMKLSDNEIKKKIHEWRNWLWVEIYQRDPDEVMLQEAKTKKDAVPFS